MFTISVQEIRILHLFLTFLFLGEAIYSQLSTVQTQVDSQRTLWLYVLAVSVFIIGYIIQCIAVRRVHHRDNKNVYKQSSVPQLDSEYHYDNYNNNNDIIIPRNKSFGNVPATVRTPNHLSTSAYYASNV
jgi:uncharacterized membrane protein (DUF485 family)